MTDQFHNNASPHNATLEKRLKNYTDECLAQYRPPNALNKKKRVGKGKGTFIERDLFESDAFWALTGAAPQMLIFLLGEREFRKTSNKVNQKKCVNADNLTLSYIELKELRVTQPRATRGFDELLAKGFITIEHAGGGCKGDQSVYALSNQWMFWKKGTVFSKRPDVVKRGFQGGSKKSKQHTNPLSYTHTKP
jgi:hypothetical protein